MKANEILQAAQMYNRIFAAMKECEKVNAANGYRDDYLFVECSGGTHYTNELCDIMPNAFNQSYGIIIYNIIRVCLCRYIRHNKAASRY